MIIKMLTTSAGPDGVRSSGREYDVPEPEAVELVEGGYAVYTARSSVIDTAGKEEQANEAKPEVKEQQPLPAKRILKRKPKR